MGRKVQNSEPAGGIRINRKSIAVFIRIALIIFIWYSCYRYLRPHTGVTPYEKQYYTVLVMGTDKMDGINRSDTIILGFLDVKTKKASALFIPRDTRAFIPEIGIRKINAAYALGSLKKYGANGIAKARQTIEDYLGIKIDFYAKVDLDGFVNIIDALGGITVRVMRDMHYVDKAGGLYIDIKKGLQVLNGKKAMQYVRFREKKKGDIGRISRQQKFIKAVLKKVKSPAILLKIPKIMSIVYSNLSTDMDLLTMFKLLNCYKSIRSLKDITLATLPGVPRYIKKRSFYIGNIEKFEKLYKTFFPSFFKKTSEKNASLKAADQNIKSNKNVSATKNKKTDQIHGAAGPSGSTGSAQTLHKEAVSDTAAAGKKLQEQLLHLKKPVKQSNASLEQKTGNMNEKQKSQ